MRQQQLNFPATPPRRTEKDKQEASAPQIVRCIKNCLVKMTGMERNMTVSKRLETEGKMNGQWHDEFNVILYMK